MKEQTAVERAAGLYETALQNRRPNPCSEAQFHAAPAEAQNDVADVLTLEGMDEAEACRLASAARLLYDAKRRGRVS